MTRAALLLVLLVAVGLAAAGEAAACVCIDQPLEERFDDSDAAVVGRVVAEEEGEVRGVAQRLLTFEVDQRVKGDVEKTILVRSPSRTDCDLVVEHDEVIGLLLTASPEGVWLATTCSVVDPGELVAVGGEPRGGSIKIVVGLVILGLVLLLAFVRLKRGSRPRLPGSSAP